MNDNETKPACGSDCPYRRAAQPAQRPETVGDIVAALQKLPQDAFFRTFGSGGFASVESLRFDVVAENGLTVYGDEAQARAVAEGWARPFVVARTRRVGFG